MATLLLGDCLEVMKTLTDKSIDCFICDLPYGCLSGGPAIGKSEERARASGSCTWDVKINLAEFWTQVKRLAKNDHTPVLMFCNTKFGYELIKSNESWFRYDLVWDKGHGVSFLLANKMPMKSHEMVYVFSKKGTFYKRIDVKGDYKEYKQTAAHSIKNTAFHFAQSGQSIGSAATAAASGTNRCPLSIIPIGGKSAGGHPTQKPMELYEWLIKRYVPENGTMLDPTAGSFNSVFAARALGCKSIGIEKDHRFFWNAVTMANQTAMPRPPPSLASLARQPSEPQPSSLAARLTLI